MNLYREVLRIHITPLNLLYTLHDNKILSNIRRLDPTKSVVIDKIHIHCIKMSAVIIAVYLTTLYNNSITEGYYPMALKWVKLSLFSNLVKKASACLL